MSKISVSGLLVLAFCSFLIFCSCSIESSKLCDECYRMAEGRARWEVTKNWKDNKSNIYYDFKRMNCKIVSKKDGIMTLSVWGYLMLYERKPNTNFYNPQYVNKKDAYQYGKKQYFCKIEVDQNRRDYRNIISFKIY